MNTELPPPLAGPFPADTASLTDQATRAAQWGFTGAAVGAIAQLAVGIVLARLLTPADFGVTALAFVVIGAARPLCDLGIGNAVVQRTGLTERHIRVAFTFSTLLGVAVAAALAIAAPLAAAVMRNSDVTPVLRVLALEFAISGTTVVAGALLRRRLDFRRHVSIETVSAAIGYGAVSVTLALRGYGVWSLVYGALVHSAIATLLFFSMSRHSHRPLLARRELGDLLQYGVGASVSGLVNHAALNADNFVVGRWLGAAPLGMYSRAYNLMNFPYTYSAVVISSVLFPAFAQVQDDPARLRRAYLSVTQLTAIVAAPAMVALAIAAPHLLRSVYGPQWADAALPLQILCGAGYFRALSYLGGIVALSVGRVYAELWRQAVYAGLVIAGAMVGTRSGLPGVAAGVSVAILFMFVALAQLALRTTGTSWAAYLRVQGPALVTAAFVCALALPVRLILERTGATSGLVTGAICLASAIPWAAGLLWQMAEPELHRIRRRLPPPITAMVDAFGRRIAPDRG